MRMKFPIPAIQFAVPWLLLALSPALVASSWAAEESVPPGPASSEVPFATASWPAKLGNHRAVVHVESQAPAVQVNLPWRRHDPAPETKAVYVVDATTSQQLQNSIVPRLDADTGDVVFKPATVPGDYFIYFAPFKSPDEGYFPSPAYATPRPTADAAWLADQGFGQAHQLTDAWRHLPRARLLRFEAINEFDRVDPMELVASKAEVQRLLAAHPEAGFLLFPEDRNRPIRMADALPRCWLEKGPQSVFQGQAARGEFYAFQIGFYAVREAYELRDIGFTELTSDAQGPSIPSSAMRCLNLGGVDWVGQPFAKSVAIEKGKLQPLWFGVQIPAEAEPGLYQGAVILTPQPGSLTRVTLKLEVTAEAVAHAGDDEPWRHSRLRWLDSTIGLDQETVAPFVPVSVRGSTISLLGRDLTLGSNGLPDSIRSHFNPSVTRVQEPGRELLAAPIALIVEGQGKTTPFAADNFNLTREGPGSIAWESSGEAGKLKVLCRAEMESDGFVGYHLTVTATEATPVRDIRLEVPLRREIAKYLMGMNRPGGLRPDRHDWHWDRNRNQDSVWVGDVNAGLRLRLRGENYERPLVNIYYHSKPLNLPPAWHNAGRGGCVIENDGEQRVVLRAFSGPATVTPGQPLHFDFELLLTPFKPIKTDAHWAERYFHAGLPNPADVKDKGANIINIHHATPINPFINYPFLRAAEMKAYADRVHAAGLKMKIYYTVRELTTHLPELWALRSLGGEVLSGGPGGGASWLQEHLVKDYIPAWFDASAHDPAILTAGMSRWHNFYLEGLHWLTTRIGIDGLYIDDVAYDRVVMRRARKILDRDRPGSLIDLHSWNHFNDRAGFACCLDLYMENLPYVDRIWIGEGRDYNTPPDYWLTEIAGLPFGVMGEMLEGGGNPWRGMVYGMTSRLGWGADPRAIWKVWDDFGIEGSEMIGYWDPACPVKTGRSDVLATTYVRKGQRTLVSIASWASEPVAAKLSIDFDALGLSPSKTWVSAPLVPNFQTQARFRPDEPIPVQPGKGWLLVLEPETP